MTDKSGNLTSNRNLIDLEEGLAGSMPLFKPMSMLMSKQLTEFYVSPSNVLIELDTKLD